MAVEFMGIQVWPLLMAVVPPVMPAASMMITRLPSAAALPAPVRTVPEPTTATSHS